MGTLTDYERYIRDLAFQQQALWIVRYEQPVSMGHPRRVESLQRAQVSTFAGLENMYPYLEREVGRRFVHSSLDDARWDFPQTLQNVDLVRAARLRRDEVEVGLHLRDVARRRDRARLHPRRPEQAFGVPAVGEHLEGDGLASRALSPAAARGGNVSGAMQENAGGAHIVTFSGSPPNALMCLWIQRRDSRSAGRCARQIDVGKGKRDTDDPGAQDCQGPHSRSRGRPRNRKLQCV